MAEPVTDTSQDITQAQIEQLQALFPHIFSEGKVDFAKLRATLGDVVDGRPERYSFSWAGKQDAIRLLQTPTRATLIPAREESIAFDETQHLFIEGDNLEVLKLLYRSYFGRVKMIYIDPPYNTGNDFVYPDDYSDPLRAYLKRTGQQNGNGDWLTSNPETNGRYHSAWLSMMYPRLFVARQLLRDDGVIFISIDDNEVHNLRLLMNEIFGEENFITTLIWQKIFSPKNTARYFSEDHDFILVYARNSELWTPNLLPRTEEANARYQNLDDDTRGPWTSSDLTVSLTSGQRGRHYQRTGHSENLYEVTTPTGDTFLPSSGRCWVVSHEKFLELDNDNRIWWGKDNSNMPRLKRFLSEVQEGIVPQTLWKFEDVGHTQEASQELKTLFPDTNGVTFPNPKPIRLIQRMLQIATEEDEENIIMDFFAGSSSLAHAILAQNRLQAQQNRFILVQLPEPTTAQHQFKTIADIGKERIRRVIAQMKADDEGKLPFDNGDEDLGFRVFKLAASNFRQWPGYRGNDFDEYAKQMEMFIDPLLDPSAIENTIFEVALKEGFSLTCQVEKVATTGENTVYRVHDRDKGQTFHICLDNRIPTYRLVDELGIGRDDLFICRDVALDDTNMANLALNCRLKTL